MVKFGLLTNPYRSIIKEVVRIASSGFDFVEIGIEEPAAPPQVLFKEKNTILNLLKKYKVFALAHTPYWVQFGSSHELVRKGWIEEAKKMINIASLLNIQLVNFHFAGRPWMKISTEIQRISFLNNFVTSIRELVKFAKTKDVVLMLENTPSDDTQAIKDFLQVTDKVPELRVHLDIAHAFIEGGMKKIKEYIDTFEKKIVHLHIHDNQGRSDEHLGLGMGMINFKQVVKWLKKIEYDRTITFEVFSSDRDAVHSREFFKKIWSE